MFGFWQFCLHTLAGGWGGWLDCIWFTREDLHPEIQEGIHPPALSPLTSIPDKCVAVLSQSLRTLLSSHMASLSFISWLSCLKERSKHIGLVMCVSPGHGLWTVQAAPCPESEQ